MAGPPGAEPAAFFSADGVSWKETRLATMVPNCPDWGPAGAEDVPDAEARAIATNGSEVVIVGEEAPHDAAGCANVAASVRPVAWYSPDGRTWQRSAPFEVGGLNARAAAVWPIPRGWQAAVQGAAVGTISIWESLDGLAWYRLGEPVPVEDANVYAGAAPDGTVVLSRWADATSGLRLFTSRDGRTWEPITKAGGCEEAPGTTQVVGPDARGLDAWVLVDDMRLCTSPDLLTWSGTTMTDAPSTVAQTRFGAIVLADACFGAGSTCAPDPRAYLTTDGVTWTPMAHPPVDWGRAVADGPAGVLLVGQGTADDGATTVWRLIPRRRSSGPRRATWRDRPADRPPEVGAMGENVSTRRLVVGLTVMFLLAGCAAGATPTPTPAPTATPTAAARARRRPPPPRRRRPPRPRPPRPGGRCRRAGRTRAHRGSPTRCSARTVASC